MWCPAVALIFGLLGAPGDDVTLPGSPGAVRWFPIDESRGRRVPVAIYEPSAGAPRQARLVLLSPGFGVPHTEYGYLARALAAAGYLVLSVQHQLPGDPPPDPPPPGEGSRSEYMERSMREGVLNLRFVATTAARTWPWVEKRQVILIGHSYGGDLSALLATESPEQVSDLIALDHGRVPLPRTSRPRQLSLRSTERGPAPGALPKPEEQRRFGIRILPIARAKHMDFSDSGPGTIRRKVVEQVLRQLNRFLTP